MKKLLNKVTGLSIVLAMVFTLFMPVMVNAANVKITFKATGGVVINGVNKDYVVSLEDINSLASEDIKIVFAATKEGYVLKNWHDNNGMNLEFNTEQELALQDFATNVILEAEWEEIKPEVTFDLNGGKVGENGDSVKVNAQGYDKSIAQEVYTNSNVGSAKKGSQNGPSGWSLDRNNATMIVNPTEYKFKKNTILYALWKGMGSTISFELDGGKYDNGLVLSEKISPLLLKDDGSGTLAENYTYDNSKFIKEGYEFKGWKYGVEGNNQLINDIKTEVFYGDSLLIANWNKRDNCMVMFDGNGGKFESDLEQKGKDVVYNGYAQKLDEYPKYAGHAFCYWYKDSEEDKPFNFEKTRITGNVMLKAKWKESYTVHFNYGDGEIIVEVPKGGTVTDARKGEILPPDKEGYDFSHWEYAEGDKAGNRFEYSDPITAETKLKAVCHKIYKILDGANQKLQVGKGTDLVVRADGEFEKFIKLMIDGKDVDPSNYEKEPGSTRVRVKAAYLDTLPAGDHTMTFVYNDGYVSTNFTLGGGESAANIESLLGNNSASGAPKTGDMGITLWIGLMMISTLGVIVTVTFLKKIK